MNGVARQDEPAQLRLQRIGMDTAHAVVLEGDHLQLEAGTQDGGQFLELVVGHEEDGEIGQDGRHASR